MKGVFHKYNISESFGHYILSIMYYTVLQLYQITVVTYFDRILLSW